MLTTSTANQWPGKPLTIEDIKAAVEKVKAIQQNDQWLLVDPQGRLYQGKAEQVMRVLLPHHPSLKSAGSWPVMRDFDADEQPSEAPEQPDFQQGA